MDTDRSGFQCLNSKKVKSFIPFSKGKALKCASPSDTEDYLKACKVHKVIQVTLCHLSSENEFLCVEPSGALEVITVEEADNYFCMSDSDRKRVEERCFVHSVWL